MEQARKDGLTEKEFYDWLLHVNCCSASDGSTFAGLEYMVRLRNGKPDPSFSDIERKKVIKGWCKTLANRRSELVKKGWLIKESDPQRNADGKFVAGAKRKTSTYKIPAKLWRLCRYVSVELPEVGVMETSEYEEISHIPKTGITGIQKTVIPKTGNRNPQNRDRNPQNRDAYPLLSLIIIPYMYDVKEHSIFFNPPEDRNYSEQEKRDALKFVISGNGSSIVWSEIVGECKAKGLDLDSQIDEYTLHIFDEEKLFPIKDESQANKLRRRFKSTLRRATFASSSNGEWTQQAPNQIPTRKKQVKVLPKPKLGYA